MGPLRKLLRRSFYAAAALSTLLLLATLIVWPVSYFRRPYADAWEPAYGLCAQDGRASIEYALAFWTDGKHFHFEFYSFRSDLVDHWSYWTWDTPDPVRPGQRTTLGIAWYYDDFGRVPAVELTIPFSYLALLFSILPGIIAFCSIRRRRRAARAVGLCGKCGYDLRAHAIGENCPECGTAKKG